MLSFNVKSLNCDISSNKTIGESENFTLLSHPSNPVESLAMCDNANKSGQWASQLFNSLIENKSLQKLWVGLNHITDKVLSVIITAIRSNNTLNELKGWQSVYWGSFRRFQEFHKGEQYITSAWAFKTFTNCFQ